MNEIKKFEILSGRLFDEMSEYTEIDINQCNKYFPSITNSAILWILYDFYHGTINEFKKDQMIDFIIAYDFAFTDKLIGINSLYSHLQDVLNDLVKEFNIKPHKLMVHKDDMYKF